MKLINRSKPEHEFQRDGITVCTIYFHLKHENTRRRHAKTIYIIDIRVMKKKRRNINLFVHIMYTYTCNKADDKTQVPVLICTIIE